MADFEMDFRIDSDDGDSFMNQFIAPEKQTMMATHYGQLAADHDGVMDYGMYTKSTEHATCVYCHELFDSRAALLVHKTCYFLRKGVEVSPWPLMTQLV